jgi:hypothetical protein
MDRDTKTLKIHLLVKSHSFEMVPEARIELARGITSTDFKSVASTNSATRAVTDFAGLYYQKSIRL